MAGTVTPLVVIVWASIISSAALIMNPTKWPTLAPALQRGSKGGRSASRVHARTTIELVIKAVTEHPLRPQPGTQLNCPRHPHSAWHRRFRGLSPNTAFKKCAQLGFLQYDQDATRLTSSRVLWPRPSPVDGHRLPALAAEAADRYFGRVSI